ncbi:RND transporter [Steroidobacter denitrificans]|uniref:RND transporter n=1 Tax=Steroidobacter denitrificans TaxID=465721 RepID=A0A127FEI0_STEDE|nr:efflux RND transporter periplasmic adaptor subunit [Steroidobacter denitrificans]AMN48311.1 RND transporter [Steroidobacter denitrificans]
MHDDIDSVAAPFEHAATSFAGRQRRRSMPGALMPVIVGVVLSLSGCGRDATLNDAAESTPVRVVLAATGPATATIRSHGLIANRDQVRLAFKISGIVREITVVEGAQVRRGQKLAVLEQTEIDAQVEQARQEHDKAQRDLNRGKRLHADQVISLEQLQDLRTRAAIARAALKTARFNRTHAVIVAPRDGTILHKLAEEREMVSAGEPVLILGTQDEGYIVNAGLADREIVQVKYGDVAQVRLDALPEALLTGTVTQIAAAADPSGGLFRIEVSLAPNELPLRSGMVARLAIVPSSAHAGERVYVPIGAIIEGRGHDAHVFVLEPGEKNTAGAQAHRRKVRIAFIEGEEVALADGLSAGEHVITDGAAYLEDGAAVYIVGPESPGAAP